jgi:adenylate kinase family enzyme
VGSSGSGKSTIARQFAERLGSELVELDALHWLPNWTEEEPAAFRGKVRDAVLGPQWVVDGNYGNVRELVWPRATSVIWLDYSFPRVFWRVLVRTIRRNVRREVLFGGNRESLRRSFLSRHSILLWVISTHKRRRQEFARLIESDEYSHIQYIVFRKPSEASEFLDGLIA